MVSSQHSDRLSIALVPGALMTGASRGAVACTASCCLATCMQHLIHLVSKSEVVSYCGCHSAFQLKCEFVRGAVHDYMNLVCSTATIIAVVHSSGMCLVRVLRVDLLAFTCNSLRERERYFDRPFILTRCVFCPENFRAWPYGTGTNGW